MRKKKEFSYEVIGWEHVRTGISLQIEDQSRQKESDVSILLMNCVLFNDTPFIGRIRLQMKLVLG